MQVDAQPSNATVRDAAMAELAAKFGAERIVTGKDIRDRHGTDESYHPTVAPDAVFFARSTEEVSQAVTICAKHKWPVIPFGESSAKNQMRTGARCYSHGR